MELFTPESVKSRLQQAGIWSKKQLGQHFLIDEESLEVIVEVADLQAEDTAVEIGPGMGVLSRRLLEKAGRVIAFEYDPDMIQLLKRDLPELEIVEGDVLRTAPEKVAELNTYKVVANIPYQITSPILQLFLEGKIQPAPISLTLLVQKEVGERLTAAARKPGRGYLSVLAEYFAEVRYVKTVPASSFWPAPKVDSAVIHLVIRSNRAYRGAEEEAFLHFVKRLFIQPRKQLKNVVAGIRGIETSQVEAHFATLGLPNTIRAQELTLEQWQQLFKASL